MNPLFTLTGFPVKSCKITDDVSFYYVLAIQTVAEGTELKRGTEQAVQSVVRMPEHDVESKQIEEQKIQNTCAGNRTIIINSRQRVIQINKKQVILLFFSQDFSFFIIIVSVLNANIIRNNLDQNLIKRYSLNKTKLQISTMIQSKLQKQWDYNSTPMNCDFTFLSEQPEHNSQSQQNLHLYHDQTSFNLPDVAATPLDLAIEKLRQLSRENHQISQSIHNLRSHPKLYLNPVRNQIVQKINQMKQENQKLRSMIDKAKSQPGYAEMTKKKSTCVSPWRRKIDQDFDGRSSIGRGAGSSIRIVRSVRDANQSDDTEGDNQKYQTSTYLNCKTDYIENSIQGQQFRRFKVLEEMKGNEQVRRRHLIDQLHIGLQKYQIFKQELEQLQNKSAAQNCQNKQSKQNGNQKQTVIEKIQKEKKNLMKILKSLRKRERQIANLVETYRKIHAQTSERFEQAVRMLQQLQCLQSSQEVDQQYAQVIQLQERLADLDEKIKQIDEQKIFEQIQDELKEALNRAGVNIGQWNILSSTGRVARIDQICRIFLEFMGYENKQNKKKIAQVQQYFQAQKQNHQSTLNQLKKKQQYLAKRLLQLQTNKH